MKSFPDSLNCDFFSHFLILKFVISKRLHLLNAELEKKALKEEKIVGRSQYYKYVDKFGFYTSTCCGYLEQDNTWKDTWVVSQSSDILDCKSRFTNCVGCKSVYRYSMIVSHDLLIAWVVIQSTDSLCCKSV